MEREDLIAALKEHNFGADRFGNALRPVFGLMDLPTQHVSGFSQLAVAGTRRLTERPILEQCVDEIASDLEHLSWGTLQHPYGFFVLWVKDDMIRYAKLTTIPILPCKVLEVYANPEF